MQSSARTHLLVAGICLFVIFIVWFLLVTRVSDTPIVEQADTEQSVTQVQQTTPIEANTTSAQSILINTKAGAPFSVGNFLNGTEVEQLDTDVFLIAEGKGLSGDLYQIFFNRGGSINISLLDSNLAFSRQQAETALRELIPESDMRLCSLVVSVTVPSWLSQQLGKDYSGIDHGLSFCPSNQNLF